MGRVGLAVTLAVVVLTASPALPRSGWLEEFHPAQVSALRSDGNAWAVIVGIDRYPAPIPDTVGSVADAEALRSHLIAQGWPADHILLLVDAEATRNHVADALRWLATKADERSLVVLHYSGHARDGSLLLSDRRPLSGDALSDLIEGVHSRRMWLNIAACNAGDLVARHVLRRGHLATFSSSGVHRSFGDAKLGHSIYGRYLIESMTRSYGDVDADGSVSVQEAFAYARPRVAAHTGGLQKPVIIDLAGGEFSLSPR